MPLYSLYLGRKVWDYSVTIAHLHRSKYEKRHIFTNFTPYCVTHQMKIVRVKSHGSTRTSKNDTGFKVSLHDLKTIGQPHLSISHEPANHISTPERCRAANCLPITLNNFMVNWQKFSNCLQCRLALILDSYIWYLLPTNDRETNEWSPKRIKIKIQKHFKKPLKKWK